MIETKNDKPFLRWAGGKNWLVKDIDRYIPEDGFNKYIEPFLGGGAIFFHLGPDQAVLSDLNQELIDTYEVLKDDVEGVIREMAKFKNTKECYYHIRSKKFKSDLKKAARFVYLNQTSFNGIFRVNLQGEYNVPFGFRKKEFLQPDNLRKASVALQQTLLRSRDFVDAIEDIEEGDLVFLDPPYTVTHNNNGFIKYNSKLFDLEAQHRLSGFIDQIQEIGAYYVLTNAAHAQIRQIFTRGQNMIFEVSRASLIGGTNAKRGQFMEFIITNTQIHG